MEYTGNSVPAPGLAFGTHTNDDELLYSTANYEQKGMTLEPGQGVLLLGTILARKTSTKRYVKYVALGADGAGTALGILRKTTDTGLTASSQVWLGNILYAGFLKLSKVSAANSGVDLTAGILGGRVNAVEGFFKF
jgi:hypothetical protein